MSSQRQPSENLQLQRLQQTLADLELQRSQLVSGASTYKPGQDQTIVAYKLWRLTYQSTGGHVALFLETQDNGSGFKYVMVSPGLSNISSVSEEVAGPAKSITKVPHSQDQVGIVLLKDVGLLGDVAKSVLPPTEKFGVDSQLERGDSFHRSEVWVNNVITLCRERGIIRDPAALHGLAEAAKNSQLHDHLESSRKIMQQHVQLLARYNEIKDVATGLIGMIAEHRQERIIDTMRTFDVDTND